jgi:hypothetical protein
MDERGIALPMAMIVMAILSALMAAFAVLATSEPQIAANHRASAQARSLAESGLERALWALTTGESNPGASGVLVLDANNNLPNPAPSPYDGSTFVGVSAIGGFKVTVTNGAQSNQKLVTAVGYAPNDTKPIAVRKLTATVTRLKKIDPPCAICVKGNLTVTGNANIDSRLHGCGSAAPPGTATMSVGTNTINGSGSVYGYGNGTANQAGTDYVGNVAASSFDPFTLTPSDIDTLKAMAKAQGTYYSGSVTFSSSNLPKDGIVFVDTTTGAPFTASTPDSEAADVHVSTNVPWNGWMIVAGSLHINAGSILTGLVYAQNDMLINGNATVSGAIISENKKYTVSTTIDSSALGTADILYDCDAIRSGGGKISQKWFPAPGTFKEATGR